MVLKNSNSIIENTLLKKYFIHFHFVLLIVLLFNSALYYAGEDSLYKIFLFVFFCDLFATLVIYKLEYEVIKPYVNPYLVVVFLLFWYYCLYVWSINPSVLIFFILFPFGAYTVFSKKVVIYWSIASCLAIFLTVFVFKDLFSILQPKRNLVLSNIKVVVSFALIFGFIFYYNSILIKSKYMYKMKTEEKDDEYLPSWNEEIGEEDFDENEIIFYNELYQQIEDHFEIHTPWKNSNFNIQDLAHSLQSNTNYISRAINLNAKMNFKNFVNTYRIEFIKNEIQNNKDYSRYKLVYLYSQAGFKHQSTFNKVFKKITNMTPSDYIDFVNNGS